MKSASTNLQTLLNQSVQVRAIPRLIAEWNQNRYAGIKTVANLYSEDEKDVRPDDQIECFPIASIVEPNRPTEGIINGEAISYNAGIAQGPATTSDGFQRTVPPARWYTVGKSDTYKYWTSPYVTNLTTGTFGDYEFPIATQVQPYVIYNTSPWVNKIVVGFEGSWSNPTRMTVSTTTDGTTWTTIANNPTVGSNGQVVLYLQDNGSWGSTISRTTGTKIKGVKINVFAMDRPDTRASVIEISARLEHDLSDFLIDLEANQEMDEPNFITPLGVCSANTGSVTLSNVDGRFNNENPNSPYYGIIDKNILFTGSIVYDIPAGGTEEVRLFTMYVDSWSEEAEDEAKAEVKDYSKFFQETNPSKRLIQDVTVGEAVWRICDSVGFVNYAYSPKSDAVNTQIPYFWTDGEKTVWEVFQEIAEATQTAIYFDEYGVLQIQTRDRAFDKTKPVSWQFQAIDNATKLADIEDASLKRTYEANSVDVTYKATKVSEFQGGLPVMEKVWEPDGTFVIRASNLYMYNMDTTQDYMYIQPKHATTWPYTGKLRIDGEIISYEGKEYSYFSKTTNKPEKVVVKSKEEKDYYDTADQSRADMQYTNGFTGRLTNLKRGVDDTAPAAHGVTPYSVNVATSQRTGTYYTSRGADKFVRHNLDRSTVTFGPGNFPFGDFHRMEYSWTYFGVPDHYGTSFKFTNAGYQRPGGMFIYGGAGGAGYYIELYTSKVRDERPELGKLYYEVGVFAKRADGTSNRLFAYYEDEKGAAQVADGRGVPMVLAPEVFYDLDVVVTKIADHQIDRISVYINGKLIGTFFAWGDKGHTVPSSGQFGLWVEKTGQMEYDYIYAHSYADEDNQPPDDMSVTDLIRTGTRSVAWDEFMARKWTQMMNTHSWKRYKNYTYHFDEFGSVVHEIRELDVNFEKSPVLHSRLYASNETQLACPIYEADPFSARFTLINTSRIDAIAQGEDKVTFGAENAVDQKIMVYGRLVFQEDEETITVTDDDSIRARGKISVQIDNALIQNKAEAQSLADWIVANWAGGCDEVELKVFGNPLIQLGDLVSVHYPEKNMIGNTHRYFVVATSNSFEEGLETQLTLRRAYPNLTEVSA